MKLLTTLLLLLSLSVFAGGPEEDEDLIDGGFEWGGGHSVMLDGEYFLLDFVEAGIEEDIVLSENTKDLLKCKDEVFATAPRLGEDVLAAVYNKLNEVYSKVPEFAVELKNNFVSYNWRLVRKKLVKVKDYGPSAIELEDGAEVYQVALRDDVENTVTISKSLWKKLALEQKVGLVIHEIIYGVEVKAQGSKHSYKSRLLNGLLFDQYEMKRMTFDKLVKKISKVTRKSDYLIPSVYEKLVNGGQDELNTLREEVTSLEGQIIDHLNSKSYNFKRAEIGYGGDLTSYRTHARRIERCNIEVNASFRHPTHDRYRKTTYITEDYEYSFEIYSMTEARTDRDDDKNADLRRKLSKACKALRELESEIFN